MTLLELLIAIAIALLVIGVVFSMYHSATRTLASQEATESGPAAAARAIEIMTRDIGCACMPMDDALCAFSVSAPEPDNDHAVASFCAAAPQGGDDPRWFSIEHVTYRFQKEAEGGGVLLRESVPLAGPGSEDPAVTNVLSARMDAFELRVFDGQDWVAEWTSSALPKAARLAVTTDSRSYTVEVFIAAAHRVTSSVTRAASGAE